MKRLLFLLVLGAIGSGVTYVIREREASRPVSLPCAVARTGDIDSEVTAPGRVEPVRDITVRATGDGRIEAVLAKEGDAVVEGQELVRYDTADATNRLAQAMDRVAQAELEMKDIDRDLRTTRSLIPVAGESKQKLEGLEIRYDKARLSKSLFEKELALSRSQLDKMHVRASEAGTVVEKLVEDGEWLTPGRALFRLASVNRLKVTCLVDEIDAPRLRPGNRAEVTADSLPGRKFPGKVTQIYPSARVERDSTVVKVVVEIEEAVDPSEGLRIGNQVDLRFITANASGCVLVPVESIQELRDGSTFAFVLDGGFVRRRPVKVGLQNARDTQVVEGVRAGDTVVLLLGQPVPDGALAIPAGKGD